MKLGKNKCRIHNVDASNCVWLSASTDDKKMQTP